MNYSKVSGIVFFAGVYCAMVSAKPLDIDEIGRKLKNFGDKALPAVRGVCGFVNSFQPYPQGQYPQIPGQFPGYPPFQGGFPQYPPAFYPPRFTPNFVPPVSANPPPRSNDVPSVGVATEQDDLNNVIPSTNVDFRQNVPPPPPQIQDVLKNFDKLPTFNPPQGNSVQNAKLIKWED